MGGFSPNHLMMEPQYTYTDSDVMLYGPHKFIRLGNIPNNVLKKYLINNRCFGDKRLVEYADNNILPPYPKSNIIIREERRENREG